MKDESRAVKQSKIAVRVVRILRRLYPCGRCLGVGIDPGWERRAPEMCQACGASGLRRMSVPARLWRWLGTRPASQAEYARWHP